MIQERLDLLREALPYIQRFKNKTFVVKLSGKVTEDPQQLYALAEEMTLLNQVGIQVAVIHGGGKQLTTTAERFFPKFGFEGIARSDVPPSVQASIEFTSACPSSAMVMRKTL